MVDRTCLVTGGAGFIGCALSSGLVQRFDHVVAIDKMHPQVHSTSARPEMLHHGVEFLHADITDGDFLSGLVSKLRPNVVIHLAAETGTGQSLTESTRHGHENVIGTTVLLDTLSRCKNVPELLLLPSSRAVYGEGLWRDGDGALLYPGQRTREQLARAQWDFPGYSHVPFASENTNPNPTSIYGATKLAQENILEAWTLAFGSNLSILRLQNVYGPGQSLINSYTGIVSLFARLARDKNSIPLFEDGEMLRDFVFIDDVAAAILAAVDIPRLGMSRFDIGSGVGTSLAEVAAFMAARYGAPSPHVSGQFRYGDVRHASCTIGAAKDALSWEPRWSLERGLNALCEWIDAGVPC